MNTSENKQKSVIETEVHTDAPARVVYTFQDGRKLQIDIPALSPEVALQAMAHGLKQKVVDAAAISRDPETGRAASIDQKFRACEEVVSRLLAGQWNKNREAGEGVASGGLLVRALVKLYEGKRTFEQISQYVAGLSKEQQAALRKDARVAPIIESLRPVKKSETDAAALLAGLDNMGEDDAEE